MQMKRMCTLSNDCVSTTTHYFSESSESSESYSLNGQSSPGYLHTGHTPSNGTRQIPQTSSLGTSHCHTLTAFHCLIFTFMALLCVLLSCTLRVRVRALASQHCSSGWVYMYQGAGVNNFISTRRANMVVYKYLR